MSLIQLKAECIAKLYPEIEKVWLIGSYRRGTYTDKSDIDFVVWPWRYQEKKSGKYHILRSKKNSDKYLLIDRHLN